VSSGAPVTTVVSGGIARVTIDRPDKRNALDSATIAALKLALERCAGDA
jgi:enoyl-CoA hydratase/carnithine racemase